MIQEALLHCSRIGPVRLSRLHDVGLRTWDDMLRHSDSIPFSHCKELVEECERCQQALRESDVGYFVDHLVPQDRWRILHQYLAETSFFDIETSGLEHDAPVTVIACWHKGQLKSFVEHENLDEFLDLLDDITLLASFNGSTFDVPRMLDAFHIPELPCPHLDLRWCCHHHGWKGGLKEISTNCGIDRPPDLHDADGALAVQLWNAWIYMQDVGARARLIRYCASDVILLKLLAHQLAGANGKEDFELWSELPRPPEEMVWSTSGVRDQSQPVNFGPGGPSKLRGRHKRRLPGLSQDR